MSSSRGSAGAAATEMSVDDLDRTRDTTPRVLIVSRDEEPSPPGAPEATPDRWQWSYDQASVEQFLAEVEAERERLHAAIREAEDRLEALDASSAPTRGAVAAELGALVLAAHDALREIDREHRAAIAAAREDAEAEAARVLAAAHEQALAIRARAERLRSGQGDVAGEGDDEAGERGEQPDVGER